MQSLTNISVLAALLNDIGQTRSVIAGRRLRVGGADVDVISVIPRKVGQVVLFRSGGLDYVVIPGTRSLEQYKNDFNVVPQLISEGPITFMTTRGFWDETSSWITSTGDMSNDWLTALGKADWNNTVITGHSLGGAVATILRLLADGATELYCVCFGAPKMLVNRVELSNVRYFQTVAKCDALKSMPIGDPVPTVIPLFTYPTTEIYHILVTGFWVSASCFGISKIVSGRSEFTLNLIEKIASLLLHIMSAYADSEAVRQAVKAKLQTIAPNPGPTWRALIMRPKDGKQEQVSLYGGEPLHNYNLAVFFECRNWGYILTKGEITGHFIYTKIGDDYTVGSEIIPERAICIKVLGDKLWINTRLLAVYGECTIYEGTTLEIETQAIRFYPSITYRSIMDVPLIDRKESVREEMRNIMAKFEGISQDVPHIQGELADIKRLLDAQGAEYTPGPITMVRRGVRNGLAHIREKIVK